MKPGHRTFAALFFFFSVAAARAQDNTFLGSYTRTQTMAQRWELEKKWHRGTFLITPYRPVYVTAGRRSSNPNTRPVSENPYYSLLFRVPYNNYEAKFQLSLKTKLFQGLFNGHADLWAAYTQKAHWQIYNTKLSRPFRELNYEPEVILNVHTRFPVLGFTARMVGVAFNHQSNGRALPLSRSWNRIVFHAGLDRGPWQIYLRPWVRLKDSVDENPPLPTIMAAPKQWWCATPASTSFPYRPRTRCAAALTTTAACCFPGCFLL